MLETLAMKNVTYDTSGGNDKVAGGDARCVFDVTCFDEIGNFVVEEIKLMTNEHRYNTARDDAIGQLVVRMNEWNAMPDEDRKAKDIMLPKVYQSNIVMILFDPHTGEFTRRLDGRVRIDEETGKWSYISKRSVA